MVVASSSRECKAAHGVSHGSPCPVMAWWPQAHGSAAVADCPVIQLVPQLLLHVWTAGLDCAQEVQQPLCPAEHAGSRFIVYAAVNLHVVFAHDLTSW